MRTTLTLDPEVAAHLKREMRRTGKPLKRVVNDALKRGLGMGGARCAPRGSRFGPTDLASSPASISIG